MPCRIARSRPCLSRWDEGGGRERLFKQGASSPPSSSPKTSSTTLTMPYKWHYGIHWQALDRLEPLIGVGHVFGQASGSLGGRSGTRGHESKSEKRLVVFLAFKCPAAHCKRPGPPRAPRRPQQHHCVSQCWLHLLLLPRATTIDAIPRTLHPTRVGKVGEHDETATASPSMVQNWEGGGQVEWGSGLILTSSDTSCIKLTAISASGWLSFCDSLTPS